MIATIVCLSILVLILAFAKEKLVEGLYIIWFFTGGPWVNLFKEMGSSTGNGAGMLGTMIYIVIIIVQLAILVGAGLAYFVFKSIS